MALARTIDELEAIWARTDRSPQDNGRVELIVRRPAPDERESLPRAIFTAEAGLLGDDWLRRHGDEIEAQITLMNSRVADLLAGDKARWAEAGDQLFVDLDISQDNLPPGARLQLGEAVMEISTLPHTGCTKFARRFGGTRANGRRPTRARLNGAAASTPASSRTAKSKWATQSPSSRREPAISCKRRGDGSPVNPHIAPFNDAERLNE